MRCLPAESPRRAPSGTQVMAELPGHLPLSSPRTCLRSLPIRLLPGEVRRGAEDRHAARLHPIPRAWWCPQLLAKGLAGLADPRALLTHSLLDFLVPYQSFVTSNDKYTLNAPPSTSDIFFFFFGILYLYLYIDISFLKPQDVQWKGLFNFLFRRVFLPFLSTPRRRKHHSKPPIVTVPSLTCTQTSVRSFTKLTEPKFFFHLYVYMYNGWQMRLVEGKYMYLYIYNASPS